MSISTQNRRFVDAWNQWTHLVVACINNSRSRRMSQEEYWQLHQDLLDACRAKAASGNDAAFYHEVEVLVEPWSSYEMLCRVDRQVLFTLLHECRQVNQVLGLPRLSVARRSLFSTKKILLASAILGVTLYLMLGGDLSVAGVRQDWQRLMRRIQFSLHGDMVDLKTFAAIAAVVAGVGMWLVNTTDKS